MDKRTEGEQVADDAKPEVRQESQGFDAWFTDLLQGNLSLPMVYWVYGVLAGFVWPVAIISITQLFDEGKRDTVGQVLYFAMVTYFCLIYVGIWKSATKYRGNKIWSILAKFVVVIAGIPMTLSALKVFMAIQA